MNSSIEAFRAAVGDEGLPPSERKAAAEHYIAALMDAAPEPAEDDAEVIALLTPPRYNGVLADIMPKAWAIQNETRGWAASGPTRGQAHRHIHERRRTKLLETIYKDSARHGLERAEAAQRILDALPSGSIMRRNGYTAQRLIEEAQ